MAVIAGATALGVAAFACGVVYWLGPKTGLVDRPDGDLKTHDRPVVALGGIGVLAGLLVGLWVGGEFDIGLVAAAGFIWLVGLIDDWSGLSPVVRLVAAALAGLVVVIPADVPDGFGAQVFWVLTVVVMVNAINLLDGLDGLAASVSVVVVAGLWAFGASQVGVGPTIYAVSGGAMIGFLIWNWPPARLFLGDNGAYVIALTITWLALRSSPDRMGSLLAIALIGVPLIDLGVTVVRRLISDKALTVGDRDHTYDRLQDSGWPVWAISVTFAVAQALWATMVLSIVARMSDGMAVISSAAVGAVAIVTVGYLMSRGSAEGA